MTDSSMLRQVYSSLSLLKGTMLHPQWLSDRYHAAVGRELRTIGAGLVLDIGSGDARYHRFLAPGIELVRIDYPGTNQRYRTRPDVYADAADLAFKAEAVDAVLIFEVLEHVERWEEALAEIRRVLRPGGRLYLSVPFIYPVHDAPFDFWRFSPFGLQAALERCGFAVDDLRPQGNSLVTALQMLNLALLELALALHSHSRLLGLATGALIYPFCVLTNLLAVPLLPLKRLTASCFGHYVLAHRVR